MHKGDYKSRRKTSPSLIWTIASVLCPPSCPLSPLQSKILAGLHSETQRGTGLLGFRTLEAACLDCVPVPLRLQLRLLLLPPKRAQHRSFSKPVAALSEVFSSSFHWLYPAQIPR